MMEKLTQEEKELLAELMVSKDWQAVVKLCDILCRGMGDALVAGPVDKDELLALKLQYDGARKLVRGLEAYKRDLSKRK